MGEHLLTCLNEKWSSATCASTKLRKNQNYLHRLIQKGAKNTINITNSHFLDNNVFIPEKPELINIVNLTSAIEDKLVLASRMLDLLKSQKGYLLSKMFI